MRRSTGMARLRPGSAADYRENHVSQLERGVSIMASTSRNTVIEASATKQLLANINAYLTQKKVQDMRTQITSTKSGVLSEL
ncbi:hypothetical protein AC579_2455 [Pseudocercospora musae]|uniref:Uncharacterized protein n=1 Tax=Pseudocercospora musae TaxID=113226 RepID=A0A139IHK8_9PEZI|nr:hypothetical protein AC579_2455 [Pseudocercospora musae]